MCERMNKKGAWQFPQGGVGKGEGMIAALLREVEEEVGLLPEDYDVIEYREGYAYTYPCKMKRSKKRFDGQIQTYFLCHLKENAREPDVFYDACEFRDFKWISPKKFKRKWLPVFKEDVYEQVMWDFFGVELKE